MTYNPDNYASLEAAKRLVEVGIELETEMVWKWISRDKIYILASKDTITTHNFIPAPSMAEVWRELPATVPDRGLYVPMKLRKSGDGKTWGSYFRDGSQIHSSIKANVNPTDALIDLLIWVRKEDKDD